MPTTRFPTDFHPLIRRVRIERFPQTQTRMSLIHKREILSFFNIIKVFICNIPNIIPPNHHGIIFSNPCYDFILLGLIIYDRLLNS